MHQRSYVRTSNDNAFELGRRLGMRRSRRRPTYVNRSSSFSSVAASTTGIDDEDYASSRVYLPIRIAGKNYVALLDTGCEVTVIPTKLVRQRQLQYTSRSLIAAN